MYLMSMLYLTMFINARQCFPLPARKATRYSHPQRRIPSILLFPGWGVLQYMSGTYPRLAPFDSIMSSLNAMAYSPSLLTVPLIVPTHTDARYVSLPPPCLPQYIGPKCTTTLSTVKYFGLSLNLPHRGPGIPIHCCAERILCI